MRLFILFAGWFALFAISCKTTYTGIEYTYTSDVEKIIKRALETLKESPIAPEKEGTVFVKMMYCGGTTSMVFNFYENVPKPIQKQISQSNRYLVIDKMKIPILFDLDDGNALVRALGVNHGILGGYLLEFDARGNQTISEMVN